MGLGINIPNVIFATLMLILIMLGIAALFLGFFWVVYRLGTIFYKWLAQRRFYIQFRRRRQEWWKRNREAATWWWESIAEVLIDPAFYGYVLVTLYQRLQAISDYAKTYPQYSFWQLLDLDTRTHMQYYVVLLIIFTLWMFWRLHKHSQEVRFQKNISAKLDKLLDGMGNSNKGLSENIKQNSEDIKQLAGSIEKLAQEIREDREDKRGKSSTHM